MAIEQDIQQEVFKSSFTKAVVNIIYTSNWISNKQLEVLKPFDLTLQQYNVLRILRGQFPKPITVNAIIERMLDKMSNASRLVDKLLAKGMVERRECPEDRRAVDVVITRKGLDLLAEIDMVQQEWESNFYNLCPEEASQLSNLLDKMRNSKS